jgi:hypothetical protein
MKKWATDIQEDQKRDGSTHSVRQLNKLNSYYSKKIKQKKKQY